MTSVRKDHQRLLRIVKALPTDYAPWGDASHEDHDGDCSSGCIYYRKLEGMLGMDWGICMNPRSPRAGLLTFEHQGGSGCFTWDRGLSAW